MAEKIIAATAPDAVKSEAQEAVEHACKMLTAGIMSRAGRFANIRKNEDMYNGITAAALRGRNNVPFDCFVMGGFIDTLLSNITEEVQIKFNPTREQDKMASDKMTAAWERETAADKGALTDKMLDMKHLMAISGRGFMKEFVESVPRFRTDFSVCDHYDMVTEAKGGGDLDTHLYKFQMNIFRSKDQLMEGVAAGYYEKMGVRQVINRYDNASYFKKNEEIAGQQIDRWNNWGISTETNSFVGTRLYRLTEGVIYFRGKWKYIVFSAETKTAIRYEPLEAVFAHAKYYPGRGPWTSSATHRHPFAFWTKAPADDIRALAYTMKKVVNLALDNLEKRNWDMTAYDPKMFPDPSQLLYRQDGLARAQLRPGQDIARGIYKFQTPDTTSIVINLTQWLDSFLGKKIGISDDAQGAATSDRVGIVVSNLEEVSKRLRLYNKMLRAQYTALGTIFDYGAWEHLREPYAVKLIGNNGIRWQEEITHKDTDADFSISVISGDEDMSKNAVINQKRQAGFAEISANPVLMAGINKSWYTRTRLKDMGYTDEQTRVAMDVQNDGDEEGLAKAAQVIQDCIDGKEYLAMYRNASTAFVRKILDFAAENFELLPEEELAKMSASEIKKYEKDMEKFDKLVAYAEAHIKIATDNMADRAVAKSLEAPAVPGGPETALPTPAPVV